MSVHKPSTYSLFSRIFTLQAAFTLLLIMITGFSLTQYACYSVNERQLSGAVLTSTLYSYFFIIGVLLASGSFVFHYLSIRRLLKPIRQLSQATHQFEETRHLGMLPYSTSPDIEHLIQTFDQMSRTIKHSEMTKDLFLRDLSHDLRTPLTTLSGYLEALQHNTINGSSTLYASLGEETQRMIRLLNQLDTLQKTELPVSVSSNESFSLQEAFEEIFAAYSPSFRTIFKSITIEIEDLLLNHRREDFIQMITNLFQNIVDYNTGTTLLIQGTSMPQGYQLSFTHQGQFIAQHEKELIFEQFYRCDTSRSSPTRSGLGLSIVRKILYAQNGTITLNTDGYVHCFSIQFDLTSSTLNKG